jgi:hypothetical protein
VYYMVNVTPLLMMEEKKRELGLRRKFLKVSCVPRMFGWVFDVFAVFALSLSRLPPILPGTEMPRCLDLRRVR